MEAATAALPAQRQRIVTAPLFPLRHQAGALLLVGLEADVLRSPEHPLKEVCHTTRPAIHVDEWTAWWRRVKDLRHDLTPSSVYRRQMIILCLGILERLPAASEPGMSKCRPMKGQLNSAPVAAASKPISPQPSEYLVSPVYDYAFFRLPPTTAFYLGILVSDGGFAKSDQI
jgi:hypothetical protein